MRFNIYPKDQHLVNDFKPAGMMIYTEDNRQETIRINEEGPWTNSYSLKSKETYEYTPWGVLLTSADKNNLLYTSREFDFDVGLQYNRMRYYNPKLGRFMQKDLIIHKENLYAYAKNRPAYYKDKFGLLPEWF